MKKAIGSILIVLLISFGGFYFQSLFHIKEHNLPVSDCDLSQQACSLQWPEGPMVLDIQPRGIPLLTPLTVKLKSPAIQWDRVELDFAGLNMNMGFNRIELKKSGTEWQGRAFLPSCIRQRMDWKARLILHRDQQRWVQPFIFTTIKS